jgi:glyoxylase-like metal-dependent hydrolase (beta-lactamase superfamily II)
VVTQGASLRAMHTPGHATDHCCFLLEEEAALFTGDNVLGVGSAVITELDSYMTSLQRMVDCQPRRLYPGHGPEVEDGPAKLREYQAHRLARIQQVCVSVWGSAAPESSPRLAAAVFVRRA